MLDDFGEDEAANVVLKPASQIRGPRTMMKLVQPSLLGGIRRHDGGPSTNPPAVMGWD
jgi:hypothetical protein